MFEQITNIFYAVYLQIVNCCCFSKNKGKNSLVNEYDKLPDSDPVTELPNLRKLNIQIPKYQFILLEDD